MEHRADGEQAIEPTSRLVDGFADEVRWELIAELFPALMRVAPLSKRHRSRIEPAVDDFRNAAHSRIDGKGALISHRVDVGTVDLQVVRQLGIGLFRIQPNFRAGHSRLGKKGRVAIHGLLLPRLFAFPDRERRPPESFARDGPVDIVPKKIAKTPLLDVFGMPIDRMVIFEEAILELRRADEPALTGVLDEWIVLGADRMDTGGDKHPVSEGILAP